MRSAPRAFTVDDGPEPGTTARVLDTLERECMRASFFLLGRKALAQAGESCCFTTARRRPSPCCRRCCANRDYRVVHVIAVPRHASAVPER